MTLIASTFLDLQNRVKQLLYGITWNQEQFTYLTNSIGAGDLTFSVNDATAISRGLIEVDSELMNVQTFNLQTNTITVFPFGRGFYGSVAATHAANASVINNAKFPKVRVQESINDIINEVYPTLFAVLSTNLTKNAVQYGYPLPATADEILNVNYAVIGPSQIAPSMRRWRFDPNADPAVFPTGKSVNLLEEVTPGRTMRVQNRLELEGKKLRDRYPTYGTQLS